MQDLSIIQQLGQLFLGAIPTALLFLVLVVSYQYLVQGPLTAVLARRRALTEGAMEEARKAVAEAENKTAEYAERLRQARVEAYKAREQRVKQWNAERDAALDEARKAAGHKVRQAKTEIDAETASARQNLQASAADLAGQALRAVLPAAAGGTR
jgi:F-type H+-transporting ATPase subunit b